MRISPFKALLMVMGVLAYMESSHAQSAEPTLSLYGVKLKDADATAFIDAAQRVGAHRIADQEGLPTYDSTGAGVPALNRFSLLADGGKVVAVQFEVGASTETLRKMLIAKYGPPRDEFAGLALRDHQKFDAQHLSECRFVWHFPDGMALVWKQDFFGATVLSYTDVKRFKSMMIRAQQNADASAVHQAATSNANF